MSEHRDSEDRMIGLISELDPAPLDEVEAQLSEGDRERARQRARSLTGSRSPRRWLRRAPRVWGLRLAGVGALIALGVAALTVGGGPGVHGGPRFAEAAVRVAETNPRLLVMAPGWSVSGANEFERDSGDIHFAEGDHRLDMTWYPARYYRRYYRDRSELREVEMEFPELGPSRTIAYSSRDHATMLEPEGGVFVEIRANLPAEEYRRVLGSMESVDVETWLAAMPDEVVKPAERSGAVDAIVADMPLPPGLDLGNWRQEAVAAMRTSRRWDALREIEHQGGYSQVVWEYADYMRRGREARLLSPAGADILEDGRVFEFGPKYATGLGCASEYRRLREGR